MRVWFNHWFSTAYRIMELIKSGAEQDGIHIQFIGSNTNKYMVYKEVCDEFYVEPEIKDKDDYIDWCLAFCKEHNIDVFYPRRNFVEISRRVQEFQDMGVKVIVDDNYELLKMLDDKVETAKYMKSLPQVCEVPHIEVINVVQQLKKAYNKVKETAPSCRVCIKYARGEGATSFRVIDDGVETIKSLDSGIGMKMSYNQVEDMLGSVISFDDLMVMPYLDGTEISIDCLNLGDSGFIAVPRYKLVGRVTHVTTDKDMVEKAKAFGKATGLKYPFNLQLRYHKGKLHILEVNTRMSGGVHLSCLSGVNIPYLALRQVLGLRVEMPKELKELKVTHIETPIVLG